MLFFFFFLELRSRAYACVRLMMVVLSHPLGTRHAFLSTEAAISMLADADCLPDGALEFYQSRNCKVITGSGETYSGTGQLALSGLVDFYVDLTTSANAGAMAELHTIDG